MMLRVTVTGNTLSLFSEPHESSRVLPGEFYVGGLRTGMLLIDLGAKVPAEFTYLGKYHTNYDWVLVLAPDGSIGWAASGGPRKDLYLERMPDV